MSIRRTPIRIAVFDAKSCDRRFLEHANVRFHHQLAYFEAQLDPSTAVLAEGFPAICVFVNDRLDEAVLKQLAAPAAAS